jgi:HAE1 family hydrophobic/amphiphilic exporter-1
MSLQEAAIQGGKLRFRPIMMTSFAFIAGLLPLVVATGPGAIGNRTIGTSAVGGMLVGTVLGVLVIPGLYYIFGKIADKRYLLKDEVDQPLSELVEHRADHELDPPGNGRQPQAATGARAPHNGTQSQLARLPVPLPGPDR